MMSTLWKRLLVVAVLAACCSAEASAQQAPEKAPAPAQAQAVDDEEEAFDGKLRQFGYWSGAAFACVGEANQYYHSDREVRREVRREIRDRW